MSGEIRCTCPDPEIGARSGHVDRCPMRTGLPDEPAELPAVPHWRRRMDRAAEWVADRLPRSVAYWAAVRMTAYAVSGPYAAEGLEHVRMLSALDVLHRWPYPPITVTPAAGGRDIVSTCGGRFVSDPATVDARGGWRGPTPATRREHLLRLHAVLADVRFAPPGTPPPGGEPPGDERPPRRLRPVP